MNLHASMHAYLADRVEESAVESAVEISLAGAASRETAAPARQPFILSSMDINSVDTGLLEYADREMDGYIFR
jgi:hypothetical protein